MKTDRNVCLTLAVSIRRMLKERNDSYQEYIQYYNYSQHQLQALDAYAQKRYAEGQGNIVGQDIGPSAGFGTLSLNAGWKINKYVTLQGGIDNLFDKSYAEFVSKGADPSAGVQTTRVNEPGRQYWMRLQVQF